MSNRTPRPSDPDYEDRLLTAASKRFAPHAKTEDGDPSTSVDHVFKLIVRASDTRDSGDAMRFTQAALNAANALCAVNAAFKS
jgi:hypothetical protein